MRAPNGGDATEPREERAGTKCATRGVEGACDICGAPAHELVTRLPSILCSCGHQQNLRVALAVLDRLGSSTDDEHHTRGLLHALAMHATSHGALTDRFVEVLSAHENPRWFVEVASQICDHSEEGIQKLVGQYKELLSRDRTFLVPVISSLGELPLPDALKMQMLGLMQESLDIVEEADVPTVMRALLAAISAATRPKIIQALRRYGASSVSAGSLPQVVEIFGAALQADSASATVFLQAVRRERALSPMDVATLVILVNRRSDRTTVRRVVLGSIRSGSLTPRVVQRAIGGGRQNQHHQAPPLLEPSSHLHMWLSLVEAVTEQASNGSTASAPTGIIFSPAASSPQGERRVRAVLVAIYASIFCAHDTYAAYRGDVISAVLRACLFPRDGSSCYRRHRLQVQQQRRDREQQATARAAAEPATRGKRERQQMPWAPQPCSISADAASGALLVMAVKAPAALSEQSGLLEEALYHTGGEKLAYTRICSVLARLALTHAEGLWGSLLIFCQKQLFALNVPLQWGALQLAHALLLHSSAPQQQAASAPVISPEERRRLLCLVMRAVVGGRSLGASATCELSALLLAPQQMKDARAAMWDDEQLALALDEWLLPALRREAGGGGRPTRGVADAAWRKSLVEVAPSPVVLLTADHHSSRLEEDEEEEEEGYESPSRRVDALRMVAGQWAASYHRWGSQGCTWGWPQQGVAHTDDGWGDEEPVHRALPALLLTVSTLCRWLGRWPTGSSAADALRAVGGGAGSESARAFFHPVRYLVPARAIDFAKVAAGELSSLPSYTEDGQEGPQELCQVAWCCYYTAVAARTVLSGGAADGPSSLSALRFSYRWLGAAREAIDTLEHHFGGSGNSDQGVTRGEVQALRRAMASLPPLPVGAAVHALAVGERFPKSAAANEAATFGAGGVSISDCERLVAPQPGVVSVLCPPCVALSPPCVHSVHVSTHTD